MITTVIGKLKQNPIIYLAGKVWEFSRGNRKNVGLYISLLVAANSVNLLQPLVVARFLNVIQERGVTSQTLPLLIQNVLLFLLITFCFWTFHAPGRIVERRNAFLVKANYKKYLLAGVLGLPPEWHADHHSGDTIDKIEKGTAALYRFAESTFEMIESVVRVVGSYIVLVYFNLSSAYIVLFFVVLTLTMVVRFDKVLMRQYKELYRAENKISEKIFDAISNITTVIILRIEKLVSNSVVQKIIQPFNLYMRSSRINEVKWFLVAVCGSMMTVSVIISYLFVSVKAGHVILAGTVYALYGYVANINELFFRFARLYGDKVQGRAAVMNAEEISGEFRKAQRVRPVHLGSRWKVLEIKNLAFSYPSDDGTKIHLDNISLSINRGARIALIGESGSGKTTLLKLIRELYYPKHVDLFLDGVLVPGGFRAISDDITLIPQEPEIFSTTILENITVGVNHELSYIKKFTDMARFTDVAMGLPKQFNSFIFEKGVNLSGGEKQRLALARGLLACADKPIVLLDEPTSSVDTHNELAIFENIFTGFKMKTIIASVHRLHLLNLFDTIYMFRDGKIVASGDLPSLLANSPSFRKQWDRYHRLHPREQVSA